MWGSGYLSDGNLALHVLMLRCYKPTDHAIDKQTQ